MAVGELGWSAAHAMIGCAPFLSYKKVTRDWAGMQHKLLLAVPRILLNAETGLERSTRYYWLCPKFYWSTDVTGER